MGDARYKSEEHWRAWMAAAQEGDDRAYERLLTSVLPLLHTIVRRKLRNPTSAEDVVQNILLSIHRARHTYDPRRPFGPWLRAIARNSVTDALRAGARRGRREVPLDEPDQIEAPAAPTEMNEPLSPALLEALSALPVKQREAVKLLHIDQLSVAEAAACAGTSPGALKVRAHRGYTALRKRLKDLDT